MQPVDTGFSKELRFAIETAHRAGNLLMQYHGKENAPEWVTTTNFRTEVDKKSDKLIRTRIIEAFPEDDIYSEEQDPLNRGRKRKWVYDPLDGTIPFTTHTSDNFSVCIALIEDKTPVLGVVYMPKRDELYVAEIGRGAFCNDVPIRVSDQTNLNRSVLGLDGGKETEYFKRVDLASYVERFYSSDGISCFLAFGCASVPLCQVASGSPNRDLPGIGRLDSYIALSLEPWDMAASVPIIREAGGKVTTLDGKEWELGEPSIMAANPTLHGLLYQHLNKDL